MLFLVVCLISGACVCAFGMWAFLRGQSSMADILGARGPGNLHGPLSIARELKHEKLNTAEQKKYEEQVRSLFSETTGGK